MKKVLLVSINRCKYPYPVYPLGMSHIAASLLNHQYDVKLLDMGIHRDTLENVISEFDPDFIGLSIRNVDDIRIDNTTFFIPELSEITTRIRACTQKPIILGGSAFSLFPSQLLQYSNADFGIISEGEDAVVQLLNLLSTHKPQESELASIPGLVYRSSSEVKINNPLQIDPCTIPAAFRDTPIESYYRETSGIINIQTQRGCPCHCCYCTYPLIEGNKPRYRPAEQVIDEILEAKSRGNQYFYIVDSVFNTNAAHVTSICEELIRRSISIDWGCFLKPSNLTEELVALMGRAGLKHIEFGTDSFCDTVLNEYGKDFTFDDILRASEWARIHKINFAHFLIIGGPGETEQTIIDSFNNSRKLKKTVIFPFTGMRLFPGTDLFRRALNENYIKNGANFLEPTFYVSPAITQKRISELLKDFQRQMPNWIIEDIPPELVKVMNAFRKKGINGPLWEFLIR